MPKRTSDLRPETDNLRQDASQIAAILASLEEDFVLERLTSYWRIHTKRHIFEFTRLGKLRTIDEQFAWPRIPGQYYARLNE